MALFMALFIGQHMTGKVIREKGWWHAVKDHWSESTPENSLCIQDACCINCPTVHKITKYSDFYSRTAIALGSNSSVPRDISWGLEGRLFKSHPTKKERCGPAVGECWFTSWALLRCPWARHRPVTLLVGRLGMCGSPFTHLLYTLCVCAPVCNVSGKKEFLNLRLK